MLDMNLLKQVLVIAIASGCVTTLTVQKIKEQVSKKKWLFLISFLVSMIIGTLFAKSFSDATWIYSTWCGFFSWIDANLLYSALENKVFKPFSEMKKVKKLERSGE
jgi:hypothetical protein